MSRPTLWNPIEALTELQEKLYRDSDMEVTDIVAEIEKIKTYLTEMLGEF